MKVCKTCLVEKPLEDFHSNGASYTGRKKYKPSCRRCENTSRRERFINIIRKHYGELKCSNCGYDKSIVALDCHHLNPQEKDKPIARMKSYSEQKIIEELKKCVLLCANCHREIHETE